MLCFQLFKRAIFAYQQASFAPERTAFSRLNGLCEGPSAISTPESGVNLIHFIGLETYGDFLEAARPGLECIFLPLDSVRGAPKSVV